MASIPQALLLGQQHHQAGDLGQAEQIYRQILQADPRTAEAWYLLGAVCQVGNRLDEAVACYQEAVRLWPDFEETHYNLGNVFRLQGKLDEAVACYRKTVSLKPDHAEARNNLGNVLRAQGRLGEAEASLQQALGLKSDLAETHHNLGNLLRDQGRLDEAAASYQRAIDLQVDLAYTRNNRAQVYLLQGNYEEGWVEYEWRWRTKEFAMPPYPQPLWDGSPLAGRTILLHAEQGLGDTLQFIRYAPLVRQRGGRVIVRCQAPLVRLLETCPGLDLVAAREDELPPFEVHAPLLSLPRLFHTTLATVPTEVPYLSAPPDLMESWQRELSPLRAFKVGIVWQGNPDYKRDQQRSIPLAHFTRLAGVEGVQFFSLQKQHGLEQVPAVAGRLTLGDLGGRLDEASGPFSDTAAVLKNLDLVITCDTSIAHLAGALAVPVWVALPYAPDWRWMLGREDSPWYPTLRLFRQPAPGDWATVFDCMAVELERIRPSHRPTGPNLVEVSPPRRK
jgi:Flp pilus assembly protein TadD